MIYRPVCLQELHEKNDFKLCRKSVTDVAFDIDIDLYEFGHKYDEVVEMAKVGKLMNSEKPVKSGNVNGTYLFNCTV